MDKEEREFRRNEDVMDDFFDRTGEKSFSLAAKGASGARNGATAPSQSQALPTYQDLKDKITRLQKEREALTRAIVSGEVEGKAGGAKGAPEGHEDELDRFMEKNREELVLQTK